MHGRAPGARPLTRHLPYALTPAASMLQTLHLVLLRPPAAREEGPSEALGACLWFKLHSERAGLGLGMGPALLMPAE